MLWGYMVASTIVVSVILTVAVSTFVRVFIIDKYFGEED